MVSDRILDLECKERPYTHSLNFRMTLSRLDLSLFTSGNTTDRQHFASDLLESLRGHGFVKIVNHGIPDHIIARLFEWVRVYSPRLVADISLMNAFLATHRINCSSRCRHTTRVRLLTARDLILSEVGAESGLRTLPHFTGKVCSSLT